jgi:hypothetical protein
MAITDALLTTTMITLTKEQQERLIRKKEARINWLAGIVLCLYATAIGTGFGIVSNPAGFAAWLLLDVIVLTSAFIIKWALTRLFYAWKQKSKNLSNLSTGPTGPMEPKRCNAYAEYGIGCELPTGHEGAHFAHYAKEAISPAEPANPERQETTKQ